MTVQQLIDELGALPPDEKVYLTYEFGDRVGTEVVVEIHDIGWEPVTEGRFGNSDRIAFDHDFDSDSGKKVENKIILRN